MSMLSALSALANIHPLDADGMILSSKVDVSSGGDLFKSSKEEVTVLEVVSWSFKRIWAVQNEVRSHKSTIDKHKAAIDALVRYAKLRGACDADIVRMKLGVDV